ncbi:hypothetical protein FBZ93_1327 [Bradyrhizobium macuxiense]|uniref:Uncharacterized protein n=1 Tax=Bradyrhizobium macuxiense TaxID=1755647 RepID=A0A560KS73_9BRAD|nr:hypothetical protein FBZ93_1327 [Bradyrhizobium macuxiense]
MRAPMAKATAHLGDRPLALVKGSILHSACLVSNGDVAAVDLSRLASDNFIPPNEGFHL